MTKRKDKVIPLAKIGESREQPQEVVYDAFSMKIRFNDKGQITFTLEAVNETMTTVITPRKLGRTQTEIVDGSGNEVTRVINEDITQVIQGVVNGNASMLLMVLARNYAEQFRAKSWYPEPNGVPQ